VQTLRETILTGLHTRLSALPATALRGEVLPERVPADGLLILRDGDPGEPDVTLNPVHLFYRYRAEIEAFVTPLMGGGGEALLDTLVEAVATALSADRSLGGLVENLSWSAPEISVLAIEGAAPILCARLIVTLEYLTADPLAL
jgi:hypothetical protein